MNSNFSMVVFFLLFVLYWRLLGELVESILEGPRFKTIYWIFIGAANAPILTGVWSAYPDVELSFGVMMILMLAEFVLFFRDHFSGALLCALACCLHVIAVFIIVLGAFSLNTGRIPAEVLAGNFSVVRCMAGVFFLLDICILCVLKLVPLPMVKLINQHREQQWFIIAWMSVSNLCLLYMESLLHQASYPASLARSHIVVSVSMMTGLYIVLFFSIKSSSLLGYREKNEELEQAIHKEQEYRRLMVRDAIASYEINVTQNLILKGFEEQRREMGGSACSYTEMLNIMSRQLIYSEDIAQYIRDCERTNVLRLFDMGENELVTEYRRLSENGEYIWVRSIINLIKETKTGDIKAFVCVKNIDGEKKKQLELQHLADRDALTGLYNRSSAGRLIDEHLSFAQIPAGSALFMIDVDNFKKINDNMGHIFGDVVLCELADHLKHIFRNNDITARIGGDEYIAFIKNGATEQAVCEKAKEICKAFYVTYQHDGAEAVTVSASIGIAFFPRDGSNFQELYAHADIALYSAKNSGKNGYKVYDGGGFASYASQRTEIQAAGGGSRKGFRENRIEYVFKMLYQSENPVTAIHSVLGLVARHFSFERGYIFKTGKDGKNTSNTFEWCAEGIAPQIDKLQNIPIETAASANAGFLRYGSFVLKSLDDLKPPERSLLEPQGIKSMIQFGIFDNSRLLGYIGFDNYKSETVPNGIDFDEIKTICNILATFLVRQYVDELSSL